LRQTVLAAASILSVETKIEKAIMADGQLVESKNEGSRQVAANSSWEISSLLLFDFKDIQ
jgi:hypothetical protein